MEVHKSTNSYEEWVFEGGGWKKKKMALAVNASGATPDTVDFNAPSKNAISNSTNEKLSTPSTSQSELRSLKKTSPRVRSSSVGTAVSAASSNFSYTSSVKTSKRSNTKSYSTSSVITPKRSNENTKTSVKLRFNPTANNAATDTPDTVGMTPDADDGEELDALGNITCTIPADNIRVIQAAYGENANLYTQVLEVKSEFAKEQEIRIAYFRRGRQVLAEQPQEQQCSSSGSIADVTEVAKQRFQAVSMTYEILSQPSSKQLYDRVGLKRLLKYAQEADNENDDASVPNVWRKNTNANANTSSPIIRRRNSFEDRTGSSVGRSGTTSGRTTPTTAAITTLDSVEVARIRWSESVEELVFEQGPEERAFLAAPPIIVAQGGGDDESYDDHDDDATPVKSNEQRDLVKKLERLNQSTESTAKVLVNQFLDDVDASLGNIEIGFDDLIKYIADGEEKPKSQKAKVPPKPEVNRVKTMALNQPKRKLSSRISAYLQTVEKKPQKENKMDESVERVNRELYRREFSRSSNDDDASQDISHDADDLFMTLMKSAPVGANDLVSLTKSTPALSPGPAEKRFLLEKARKEIDLRRSKSMTGLQPSKLGTPFAHNSLNLKKSSLLDRVAEDQELGGESFYSFLPHFQSDTPDLTNMLIRTKGKKSFRKLRNGGDSVSAMTDTTNMPQARSWKECKQIDGLRSLAQPAATGTDEGHPPQETVLCLNTTLGSDPFSGVEDESAMNTTTISDPAVNVDFMSYFMAYMKNLTTDVNDIGNRVNTSVGAANKMVFDSIIISDNDMMGMLEHFHHDFEEDPTTINRAETF
jgi:hypothetical protein